MDDTSRLVKLVIDSTQTRRAPVSYSNNSSSEVLFTALRVLIDYGAVSDFEDFARNHCNVDGPWEIFCQNHTLDEFVDFDDLSSQWDDFRDDAEDPEGEYALAVLRDNSALEDLLVEAIRDEVAHTDIETLVAIMGKLGY